MKFSWINFDSTFLFEVLCASPMAESKKKRIEYARANEDKDMLVGLMNEICNYPDKHFIMDYRPIIEQNLLKFYRNEVTKICRALNIHGSTTNEKQIKMTKKPMSMSLIQAYILAILNISGMDVPITEFSKFSTTVSVNMKETMIEEIPLYDFQKEAVDRLKKHFITDDQRAGLLVMPTGSGKSRTAISFLIKYMIGNGYQVLWIAHRHMLLDQAADCFHRFAGLAKTENDNISNYRISCVSGQHLSIKSIDKHEVIVASIGSICRNKEHLRRVLGKKVVIVVDEAHHTFAPTYQDTIRFIQKCRKDVKLLGLTATPIRGNEDDSKKLLALYDNKIIYNVSMANLIAKGILSEPVFRRIETGEDFEPEITVDEEKLIRRYGELPESLVNKIASSNPRNKLILDEYIHNKEKYGKTLIFAMNVLHCRFLHEELEKMGVKCGLVYSGKEDNTRVIQDYKDGKMDVLVNVNIMTEGTDVPDIQTIFLTRPTASESLLMQMIGRGMRGIQAEGTQEVNIVDFHDKWTTFNRWLNPEWEISDEKYEGQDAKPHENKQRDLVYYDWKMCQDIYNSMRFAAGKHDTRVSFPVGWYTLVNEEGELSRMLVFENQMEGLNALMADKSKWKNDLSVDAEYALDKYFGYFCDEPSKRDIELLLDNVRTMEIAPQIHILENRKGIDPLHVVNKVESEQLDLFEYGSKLYEERSIVRDLYETKESYIMELCRMKLYKDKSYVIGSKVEELPEELQIFNSEPFYNLDELVQEVKDEMFCGVFDGISSVRWTKKMYRTYYGIHYGLDNSIKINSVLNSKDVPREVVKFVIYHELLHRDNMSHDANFRMEEHKYPNYVDCEHFLYDNMYQFDIKEW